MKKILQPIIIGLTVLSLTACRHSAKETEIFTDNTTPVDVQDNITKDIFVDNFGDKMEVFINTTKNTATVHLNGKTFELTKSEDLPDYTASSAEYQYSNIRGNVIFLKKNVDMVLFHSKQGKKESSKMASY